MIEVPKIKKTKKIARTEIVPFTRQLASMSAAGMPILTTIMTLEEQSANPKFKKVLNYMNKTIESGEPLYLCNACGACPPLNSTLVGPVPHRIRRHNIYNARRMPI